MCLAFEREIIPWVDDSDVSHCEFCMNRFSLTKRKHHCRLCGKIMCSNCSKFLTFPFASKKIFRNCENGFIFYFEKNFQGKLTNPAFAASYQNVPENASGGGIKESRSLQHISPAKMAAKAGRLMTSMLKRDGSEISLGSLLNQVSALRYHKFLLQKSKILG